MNIFLRTRSKSFDYDFLGESPDTNWWKPYTKSSPLEMPTLLYTNENGVWRLLISAIPSSRYDRTRSSIRFTLFAEGGIDDIPEVALIVNAWLNGNLEDRENPLSKALDDAFDEELCERILKNKSALDQDKEQTTSTVSDIGKRLDVLLDQLAAFSPIEKSTLHHSWSGSLHNEEHREQLVAHIGKQLNQSVSGAFVFPIKNPRSTSSETQKYFNDLLEKLENVAVLSPMLKEYEHIEPLKKKTISEQQGQYQTRTGSVFTRLLTRRNIAIGLIVGTALAALAIYLTSEDP